METSVPARKRQQREKRERETEAERGLGRGRDSQTRGNHAHVPRHQLAISHPVRPPLPFPNPHPASSIHHPASSIPHPPGPPHAQQSSVKSGVRKWVRPVRRLRGKTQDGDGTRGMGWGCGCMCVEEEEPSGGSLPLSTLFSPPQMWMARRNNP